MSDDPFEDFIAGCAKMGGPPTGIAMPRETVGVVLCIEGDVLDEWLQQNAEPWTNGWWMIGEQTGIGSGET